MMNDAYIEENLLFFCLLCQTMVKKASTSLNHTEQNTNNNSTVSSFNTIHNTRTPDIASKFARRIEIICPTVERINEMTTVKPKLDV